MGTKKAQENTLFDEAPLFAGLEGYSQPRQEKPERKPAQKKKAASKLPKSSEKQPKSPETAPGTQRKKSAAPARRQTLPRTQKIEADAILLSIREMCHLLKISRATLVRMDTAGKIPGRMKLGGSVRFHRATVENWLESLIAPTA